MKKIKRLLLIILPVVILVLAIMFFCTKPVVFYKVKNSTEYEIWNDISGGGKQDESAPKEAAVTFNGVTYTGEYNSTEQGTPYLNKMHRYRAGSDVDFYINADTGELVRISFTHLMQDVSTVDEAYCRQVADDLADDYINLKKYKVEAYVSKRDQTFYCSFRYYREAGGCKTADGLEIVVDGNGDIRVFELGMLGSFSNVLYVKKPDEYRVDEAFNKAIPELCNHRISDNLIKWEYEINDMTLVKTPDGKIAYLYQLRLYFIYDAIDQDGVPIEHKIHDDAYFVLL